ncbi:MAG: DUF368 domain-containing protein [Pseudomonadales bacterium]|nr:DUF368 domain-containing protein [Pseudomonadales bacterium]
MNDEQATPTHSSVQVSAPVSRQARLLLLLKGMAMGLADTVPGVSGGTIAVISGIYEELIHSLRRLNPLSLPLLWQQSPAIWWRHVNGGFLLTLLLGIASSLLLAANAILYLLANHHALIMGFFIGLILASSWFLQKQIGLWTWPKSVLLLAGMAITLVLALLNPLAGSSSLVYIFFSGLVAICAMILPGISGAFILLLLGVYEQILAALRTLQMDVLLVFVAGCVLGLLSFSHLLALLFRYYRQQTYAFLNGMLLASVYVLWPQELLSGAGPDLQLIWVLLLALAGFTLIIFFEKLINPRLDSGINGQHE